MNEAHLPLTKLGHIPLLLLGLLQPSNNSSSFFLLLLSSSSYLIYLGVPDNENEITRSSVRRPHCRSNVTHLIHRLAVIFHLKRHRCYTFRNWPTFFFSNHQFFYYKMNNMHKWTHIFLRKPRRSPDPAAFGNTNKKVGRLDSSRRDDKKKKNSFVY